MAIKSTKQLIEQISAIKTGQDVADVKKLIDYRLNLPEFHNALFQRLTELVQPAFSQTDEVTAHPSGYVLQDGKRYDLGQWITFRNYAQRHKLNSTSVLNNWLNRGIIPADCVVEIAVFNDLKLIRDQPYQPGGMATGSPGSD